MTQWERIAARKIVAKPIRHAYHGAMMRALILSLIMAWAHADENSWANRLMIETVGLLKEARAVPDT
jgi:hypothetical protein